MSHTESESKTVIVDVPDSGERLDKYLAAHLSGFSRNRVQQLLEQGCVTLEGATITDAARKVKPAEAYNVMVPAPKALNIVATDTPLAIIYEDDDLVIIDKPAGMTVHPGPGHTEDTLVNALLAHCGASLSGIGGIMRPGIVHRIDKDTSGLLVVAKNDAAHKHLSAQLAARTLKRQYLAVVKGNPRPLSGKVDAPIGRSTQNRKKMAVTGSGRSAVTYYTTEKSFTTSALLRCTLESGRTHQIRVHMTHIGHPLVGDQVYGRKGRDFNFHRQALHAAALTLLHPTTGEKMEFTSKLPQDLQDLLAALAGA